MAKNIYAEDWKEWQTVREALKEKNKQVAHFFNVDGLDGSDYRARWYEMRQLVGLPEEHLDSYSIEQLRIWYYVTTLYITARAVGISHSMTLEILKVQV